MEVEMRYWAMRDGDRLYALLREGPVLPERWRPSKQRWQEAPFHLDVFVYPEGSEDRKDRHRITEEQCERLKGELTYDLTDEQWAELSKPPAVGGP